MIKWAQVFKRQEDYDNLVAELQQELFRVAGGKLPMETILYDDGSGTIRIGEQSPKWATPDGLNSILEFYKRASTAPLSPIDALKNELHGVAQSIRSDLGIDSH